MKKIIISVILFLFSLISGFIIYFSFINRSQTQEVSNITIRKTENINKESDNSQSSSLSSEGSSIQETNEVDETENVNINININISTIDDNLTKILTEIKRFNSFNNASSNNYNDIVEKLKSLNVSVHESVKGPFGIFDPLADGTPQYVVLAGYLTNQSYESSETGYIITNIGRTAQTSVSGSVSSTGNKLLEVLGGSEYEYLNKEVKYQLNVSEDRMSAELIRISDQWW